MIYLDNAATTRPDGEALERAKRYLSDEYFNPSALYQEGFRLQTDLKNARRSVLSYISDEKSSGLVFTSCGSESDNTAIFGYAKRGNAVTTMGEHSAVRAAFVELSNRGVEPRYAPLKKDGGVDVEALLDKIDDKTSFVSVIHVNNETGAINDVNAIAKAVKTKNPRVIFHADGVQAFGKIPYRLSKDVDLYSVSAHKIGGLKGVGALVYKKGLAVRPFIFGGGQESGFRSGTENVFGIKVFEYAAEKKYKQIRENFEKIKGFRELLWSLLDDTVYKRLSAENGTPYILSVSAVGLRGEVLLHKADDLGLIVGTGSACSSNAKNRYSRVILSCGHDEKVADGVLRLSFSSENTEEEVRKAAEILNGVGRELQEKMR